MSGSSSTTSTRALSVTGAMLGRIQAPPRRFSGLLAPPADRDAYRAGRQVAERGPRPDQVRVEPGRVAALQLHARGAAEGPARARVGDDARGDARRLRFLPQKDRVLHGVARLGRELVGHAALG